MNFPQKKKSVCEELGCYNKLHLPFLLLSDKPEPQVPRTRHPSPPFTRPQTREGVDNKNRYVHQHNRKIYGLDIFETLRP